jgi:DNA repair ATPase RecN
MTRITTTPPARLRRLNIRLSQQEWDKVHKLSANSTCRSVSEYARKVLAEKPVKVFYRNQSFDEFEERMTVLLPLLEAFGDNFSQLIKTRSDLQTLLDAHRAFSKTTEEIKAHLEKLSDQCDPK